MIVIDEIYASRLDRGAMSRMQYDDDLTVQGDLAFYAIISKTLCSVLSHVDALVLFQPLISHTRVVRTPSSLWSNCSDAAALPPPGQLGASENDCEIIATTWF